ncbi:hypothetical protein N483_07290 [Pseudoalteromonas luteoviolacea NCIMB 1944]|nr:hypothetical protein N483_07290 [Pseudoalteromonas luteoviolacea NCIMB 1944]
MHKVVTSSVTALIWRVTTKLTSNEFIFAALESISVLNK